MVMMRLIVAFTILILGGRIAQSQAPPFGDRSTFAPLQNACRALLGLLVWTCSRAVGGPLLFSPQVDGGGDGGGGDGGAGRKRRSRGWRRPGMAEEPERAAMEVPGGDSGTGEGNSGDSDSDGDGPGADPGAVGAPGDQGDPGNTEDAPANNAEKPRSTRRDHSVRHPDRRRRPTYLRIILRSASAVQVLLVGATENVARH